MSVTVVGIEGPSFTIDGQLTYPGRCYRWHRVEGLLFNQRVVQGTFDDLNPETRGLWDYPDGSWDAERNTDEFVVAMPAWREAGLLSFTLNLQGGNPRGYQRDQPWHNSAYTAEGELRPAYMARLARILDRADELGMAPILGLFYFGQDDKLRDEEAVIRATDEVTDWLLARGDRHVLIEIANEVDVPRYDHTILRADRCHQLIERVHGLTGVGEVADEMELAGVGRLVERQGGAVQDGVGADHAVREVEVVEVAGNRGGDHRRLPGRDVMGTP